VRGAVFLDVRGRLQDRDGSRRIDGELRVRDHQTLQRRFQLWHLILALLVVPTTVLASDGEKPRVLVVPYHVGAGVDLNAETANSILVARLTKVPLFHVISQEELARMADYQAVLQGLGEDDTAGLLKLGEMVHADRLLFGSVGDVGGTVAATLTLLNVRTGEVEKRVAGTARGGRDLIIPLLNGQADAMLAHLIKTYAPEKMHTAPGPVAAPVVEKKPGLLATPWRVLVASAGLAGMGVGLGAGMAALASVVTVAGFVPGATSTSEGRVVLLGMAGAGTVALVAALACGMVLGGTVALRGAP
jgi:hypothetical protein